MANNLTLPTCWLKSCLLISQYLLYMSVLLDFWLSFSLSSGLRSQNPWQLPEMIWILFKFSMGIQFAWIWYLSSSQGISPFVWKSIWQLFCNLICPICDRFCSWVSYYFIDRNYLVMPAMVVIFDIEFLVLFKRSHFSGIMTLFNSIPTSLRVVWGRKKQ